MVCKTGLHIRGERKQANILEEGDERRATMDTGAQIPVAPFSVAKQYDLLINKLREPLKVKFGNESVEICNHYADFGTLVGLVFLLESVKQSLFCVGNFLDNSERTVTFSNTRVTICDGEGNKIVEGERDNTTKMWTIDIGRLIEAGKQMQHKQGRQKQVSALTKGQSRRGQLITPRIVTMARRLHQNWGHEDPQRMAAMFRNGSGLIPSYANELTPEIILKVFDRDPCKACRVFKFNKLPRTMLDQSAHLR